MPMISQIMVLFPGKIGSGFLPNSVVSFSPSLVEGWAKATYEILNNISPEKEVIYFKKLNTIRNEVAVKLKTTTAA